MGKHNANQKKLKDRFKCTICSKGYMVEDYKTQHEKLHKQREQAHGKNPERYMGV